MRHRSQVTWTLAFILTSPFSILLISLLNEASSADVIPQIFHRLHSMEIVQIFFFTTLQAFLSSVLALFAGILGAYGIISTQDFLEHRFSPKNSRKVLQFFEALVLLPNLAPVLLLILAAMKYLPRWQGLWGIVILHTLLNLGLVAVSVVRLIQFRLGRLTELAFVEGVGRWSFFRTAFLPLLKTDLIQLAFFVFMISFSSFAIPLMLGGSRGVTVEVLIYRALRVDGDLVSALAIAALQMIAVISLALWLPYPEALSAGSIGGTTPDLPRTSALQIVSTRWGNLVLLLPPLLILMSLFDGLLDGVRAFIKLTPLHFDLSTQIIGSVFVGTTTAILVSVSLMAFAWARPSGAWRRFFLGYAAPSSVLTGLSLLILWRATGWASLVKISFALTLIFVPAFYRMQWEALLRALNGQVRTAETLGATRTLIFFDVLMPQLSAPLGNLAGLASLWAWGDFALSSVIGERQLTLAMTAQSLMDSYRLDIATVYIWMIAFGGLISYVIFKGVGRVLGSKSDL